MNTNALKILSIPRGAVKSKINTPYIDGQNRLSIPRGAVKRKIEYVGSVEIVGFQFQEVQLKATTIAPPKAENATFNSKRCS